MIAAFEIGAGLVLTAALLTVGIVLCALQLGRLVSQDDQQRQVEAVDAPRVRDVRRARAHVSKRSTVLVALAILGTVGGRSVVQAQVPEECSRERARDLEVCRDTCIDSRDFYGYVDDCHDIEAYCLAACR